ncbi:MAG: hypothetical protein LBQ50_08340 [Planctomycetaceae bacterium]|nr:hypothetical protein [Planctomycetaceae bacterium]
MLKKRSNCSAVKVSSISQKKRVDEECYCCRLKFRELTAGNRHFVLCLPKFYAESVPLTAPKEIKCLTRYSYQTARPKI